MKKNILEYLEESAVKFPNKTAFDEGEKKLSYSELLFGAKAIGSRLIQEDICNKPVLVFLPKGCDAIVSFMGVIYGGGFYCPIDITMPVDRINLILEVLNPVAIITSEKYLAKTKEFAVKREIIIYENVISLDVDEIGIRNIRNKSVDTDPLYVIFTSGSTGIPKGVLISHKSVIDFSEYLKGDEIVAPDDVIGNQGNFYFDLSVLDIYGAISTGATVVIIPKRCFMFPVDLLNYIIKKKITMINWVPSVYCNVANLKALDVVRPDTLKKAVFCGEVMPNKQLNYWRKNLPNIKYINFYGPTEIVYACTYYEINRDFEDYEPLPIGLPCNNTKILVLNENDEAVKNDEMGELCVSGTCLALGYYNSPAKTKEAFVNNPLNQSYYERIYRTGDIVKYNEFGELMYMSRKDFQIKHLGHRIELGEIENAAISICEIDNCACIYDDKSQEIVMCYTGMQLSSQMIIGVLKTKLQSYMIPSRYKYFDIMPYNSNGKIDRIALKNIILREGECF